MSVQARFYIAEVHKHASGIKSENWAPPAPAGKVIMRPVTRGEANAIWASATPSGLFEMVIHSDALTWFEDRLATEVKITIEDRPDDE
jgi:hypothetical protein